jgi:hypothetical protein
VRERERITVSVAAFFSDRCIGIPVKRGETEGNWGEGKDPQSPTHPSSLPLCHITLWF